MPENRLSSVTWALLGASGLVLLAAPASYAQEEIPVVASADASDSSLEGSSIDVHWAERSEEGGLASVAWSVNIDDSSDGLRLTELRNDLYRYTGNAASGVTLLDEEAELRYHPLQDAEQRCLCAGEFNGPELTDSLDSGESSVYWTSYLIEDETEAVSLEVEGFAPVKDIPVE